MPPTSTPFITLRSLARLPLHTTRTTPLPLPLQRRNPFQPPPTKRFYSSPRPLVEEPSSIKASHKPHSPKRPPQPEYEMTFTCKPCSTRSTHRVSKQGYHHGSVLITCPECRNRHIISDHLNIFGDKHMTIEDLMREQGQLVKKGTLSEDGDLEFWEDGSTTKRARDKTTTAEGDGQSKTLE